MRIFVTAKTGFQGISVCSWILVCHRNDEIASLQNNSLIPYAYLVMTSFLDGQTQGSIGNGFQMGEFSLVKGGD
jgi:hypothetical protein